MAKGKSKYYVVWKGLNPGIYDNWAECKMQVDGQEAAKYKSFESRDLAVEAFDKGFEHYIKKGDPKQSAPSFGTTRMVGNPIQHTLSVDAACSGNPGPMEYRGVYTATGQEYFRIGPFDMGTNNVGEFLALVHGLAFLKKQNSNLPIYSDSRNAISWVKKKQCKTMLLRTARNEQIFDLIERAEKWLKENTYTTEILKWETDVWGEIPADFGRK
jgi:ribonuclease HI